MLSSLAGERLVSPAKLSDSHRLVQELDVPASHVKAEKSQSKESNIHINAVFLTAWRLCPGTV